MRSEVCTVALGIVVVVTIFRLLLQMLCLHLGVIAVRECVCATDVRMRYTLAFSLSLSVLPEGIGRYIFMYYIFIEYDFVVT